MTSKVHLSELTFSVLENFATINSSIVFKKGNIVKTISNAENILAEYECEEYFPQDFAIYDLSQFLSGLRILDDPTLEFGNEDYVVLRGNNIAIKYYYSDPEITLKVAPDKSVRFPGSNIGFDLDKSLLNKGLNISGKFGFRDLSFCSDGTAAFINFSDKEMDTSNSCRFDLPNATTTGEYDLNMKVDNLRVYNKASYKVSVSEQLLSEWVVSDWEGSQDVNLKYYVALEPQ